MQKKHSTYYERRRVRPIRESRGVNVAEVFADRLSNFCGDLRSLLYGDFDTEDEALMVNAAKEAVALADMYEKSDIFIDEVAGKNGFNAERNFDNDALNTLDIDFPSALRMISDCIKDALDGDCEDDEISAVETYSKLIEKFLVQLRRDYSI